MTAPSTHPDPPTPSRLEVICGPMFAGKTTLLIERLARAQASGVEVAALKPAIDTRYHPSDIVTHAGKAIPARTIHEPAELTSVDAAHIGIDEAHFFEQGLHDAITTLLARGTSITLAGLDRTSMNEPFGEMGALLIEADLVTKLTAPCAVCGRDAVHTVRLFASREPIVIGGEGMFETRCRTHLHVPPPVQGA